VRLFRSFDTATKRNVVHGGQYIRLYHKEVESYLRCKISSNIPHLVEHVFDPSAALEESNSCIVFWQVEHLENTNGGPVLESSVIRLKHLVSRKYLTLVQDKTTR
jgi:hypothetical protein